MENRRELERICDKIEKFENVKNENLYNRFLKNFLKTAQEFDENDPFLIEKLNRVKDSLTDAGKAHLLNDISIFENLSV